MFAWLVDSPNVALVGLVLGAAKVTRLVILKPSNRICKYLRSPMLNRFSIDRSAFLVMSRRRLPNCELNTRMLSTGCRFAAVRNWVVSKAAPKTCGFAG